MPKYLMQVSYTNEGAKGLMKDGGSKRRSVVEQLTQSLGGTLEAFYYALGDNDAYLILNLPDNVSVMALSLAVNASGAVSLQTTALLTVEEVDQAAKLTVNYRPPGQ